MAATFTEEQRADEAIKFFQTLYGKRKVSLARATIRDRGKTTQTFAESPGRFKPWSMSLRGHVRSMLKKADQGVEIFYAPTPMSGTRGRKQSQALPNNVMYGDADNGLTVDVKARLIELGACLVRSGGTTEDGHPKYHVYLLLTHEIDAAELKELNRGLMVFIDGDSKFDPTTLLRVPGTRNHKYAKGGPQSSPVVRVERYADKRHDPADMTSEFGVGERSVSAKGMSPDGYPLPEVPESFNHLDNKPGYAHVRRVVKLWNGRWDDPTQLIQRHKAAAAIVGESLTQDLSMDEAYAFASMCEPLLDKQEDENGYNIQADVAKQWAEMPIKRKVKEKVTPTPSSTPSPTPTSATFAGSPKLDSRFPFQVPNLDELLSGEYVPLEPTLVPCGSFFLLYAGKSHSLVADRSVGKTLIAIAMVQQIMKAGGRVAYFDFEDSPDTFIRDRMMNQYGITAEQVRNQFLYVGGSVAELDVMEADEGTAYLAEQIKDWDLVIIDGVSASMGDLDGDWDGNKDVDYKKWHKIMVQPFLDQGIATLQLDHSTKNAARAGGTMQKGAKLTGVEYQVRVDGPNGFTIGRTGKVIIEAVKDRVGRISKHRRTTPPVGHDSKSDWPWNDIATFTLTSDGDGKITQAEFEPINYKDSAPAQSNVPYQPTQAETHVINTLQNYGQPIAKTNLVKLTKRNRQDTLRLIDSMVDRGLIGIHREGSRGTKLIPIANAPTPTSSDGQAELDFSQVDRKPKAAKRRLDCHNCGDHHYYPEEFVQADDIGYQPNRRTCRSCADEGIPRDGAEWARGIRESIDRDSDTDEGS